MAVRFYMDVQVQLRGTIGQFVRDLDLISKASDAGEWLNTVDEIPFT